MRPRGFTWTAAGLIILTAACGDIDVPTAPIGIQTENGGPLASNADARSANAPLPHTIDDLLALGVGPVAIAHRGMGPNLGEDPSRPIENTLDAVRRGFKAGVAVVEVDLQMTADGEVVAWHDDFGADLTCLNTLTRAELQERAPHIVSFQAVLQTALRYNRGSPDRLTGLLTVDLKPPSPLCDPSDANETAFVEATVRIIRQMGATDLIFFNSMSPVMLGLAAEKAPEIPRQLTVLLLQLLSPEQVEAALGLPVVMIDKEPGYGLRWAEIGVIHRLPGYRSMEEAIGTAVATGSRMISYDLALLGFLEQTSPGAAAGLVRASRGVGLHVLAGDVSAPEHWFFGAALGVEALYVDDVPLALDLQPDLN